MLVYANNFSFNSDCSLDEMFAVLAEWLSRKTRQPLSSEALKASKNIPIHSGSLQTWTDDNSNPHLFALRYSHPDSRTSGRQWMIEVGFFHDLSPAASLCTILVQTSEISARVVEPVQATRPVFVPQLANLCSTSQKIPGLEAIMLDGTGVEALPDQIEDAYRQHTIVLVSATPSGEYPVDPVSLTSQLVGLAEVILVPPAMDTYWVARVLGDRYTAYRGAISVIFPCRHTYRGREAYTKKLLPEDLQGLLADGINVEAELLSIVTHRSNLPVKSRILV